MNVREYEREERERARSSCAGDFSFTKRKSSETSIAPKRSTQSSCILFLASRGLGAICTLSFYVGTSDHTALRILMQTGISCGSLESETSCEHWIPYHKLAGPKKRAKALRRYIGDAVSNQIGDRTAFGQYLLILILQIPRNDGKVAILCQDIRRNQIL